MKRPDYYHSMLWLQEAYHRLDEMEDKSELELEVLDYLSYAMYKQSNLEWAAFLAKKLKSLSPNYENIDANIDYYVRELKAQGVDYSVLSKEKNLPPLRTNRNTRDRGGRDFIIYESLCRGEYNKVKKII